MLSRYRTLWPWLESKLQYLLSGQEKQAHYWFNLKNQRMVKFPLSPSPENTWEGPPRNKIKVPQYRSCLHHSQIQLLRPKEKWGQWKEALRAHYSILMDFNLKMLKYIFSSGLSGFLLGTCNANHSCFYFSFTSIDRCQSTTSFPHYIWLFCKSNSNFLPKGGCPIKAISNS